MIYFQIIILLVGLSLSFSTISTLSPNKDSFENKSKLEKIGNKLILVSEENNFESKCEAAHILILNTVDGTMFGLNRETGDILWEKKDESIIKTNSLIKQDNNENIYNFDEKTSNSKEMILNSGNEKVSEEKSFLIPDPVNGELYVYSTDENELTKMPITMKKLVGNHPAYFSDDGSIHSNKKTSKLIAIDPFTGIILATYGDDNDDSYFNLEKSNRKAVHLGKSEYTMSIDSKFSKRKIKYSEYTISDIGEDYDPEDLLGKSQIKISVGKNGLFQYHDKNIGNKWVRNFNSPVVSVFKVGKTRDIENRYTLYKSFPLPAEEQINKKITNDAKAFVGRLSDGSFYLLPADYFNAVPATSTLIGQYAEPEHTSVPNFWDFDSDFCLENPENINCQQLVQIGYRVNEIEDTLIDDTSNENKKKDQKKKKEKKIKKEPGFFSTFFNNFSFLTNLSAVFIILAFFWKQKKVDATSNFPDSQTSDLNITNISNADESVENNNSTMLTSDVALLDLNLSSEKPLPSPPVEETEEVSIKSNTIYSAEAEEKLNSLEVTDKVLGYGSHGTIVYQGNFEGRKVAIKRLLLDFYDIAHNEVKLLQDSDHHPNVIRYFYKEKTERFMYIALELSPASLYDVIEKQNSLEMSKIRLRLKPSIVLNQIMKGVNFLHSLKIVHRDIKPQNILFSELNEKNLNSHPRLLISDFGLCKKLAEDQSSFHNTNTGGTLGWRASECIQAHQFLTKLNNSNNNNEENNATSDESSSLVTDPTLSNLGIKVSKKIDIFSSGLVFFYVLSLGQHPFGDKFVREINILKGNYKLSSLDIIGEEGVEAKDLIKRMIEKDPKKRPDAESVLMHPYFWTKQQRLSFLQDVSDRFEVEERDPPSANLKILERGSNKVLGSDWYRRIDRILLDDLQKRRSYDGNSLRDLLRALRNKKHHYQDLPEKVRLALGDLPEGFLKYFTSRFPLLFLHVYYVIHNTKKLKEEGIFQPYFKPPENYF